MARDMQERDRVILRTSALGIVANVLLAGFKAAVGLLSNSIAVILDAVNNLSDALSSVITIIGVKLASRRPNRKHPLGYGRVEYLSAMIVAALVLYAGITSIVESVKKIVNPQVAEYGVVSLTIIAVAVVVKLVLGLYVKKKGNEVESGALVASGSDAMFDAVLSASVLLAAMVYLLTGLSLEAYVGVVISVVIIKAGIEMMVDTLDDILGKRADPATSRKIKDMLLEEPVVRGAYDLILDNYGPDKNYASVHLELPDTMTVAEVDELTRRAQERVYRGTGVVLASVGVYSYNTGDDESAAIRDHVRAIVLSHDWALQFHGFYVDLEARKIRFDVVMSFDEDAGEGLKTLYREVGEAFPDYVVEIVSDVDISD